MKYQNKPVEWITTETEKIAKDKENDNVRNTALLAGGVGAAGVGTAINHNPTSKVRRSLKTGLRVHGGLNVTTGTLGAGASEAARRAFTNLGPNGLPLATMAGNVRNQSLVRAGIGAAEIIGSKYINTNPVNKKLLAAKLGLIAGGAAAAAAGTHGLMTEKKASAYVMDDKTYQDYVNRRQEGTRNTWKGVGGILGGLGLGSVIAAAGAPGLGTLAALGGYGYGIGRLAQGSAQQGQASYIDPDRREDLFWPTSITPTEARYTRDVGFLDRLTGAEIDVTKKASKEDKKEKVPSGFNRATRALLGHLVLPTAGVGTAIVGAHIHKKYPTWQGHAIRPGIGKALALGGLATASIGPWVNDVYQASKYVQEH